MLSLGVVASAFGCGSGGDHTLAADARLSDAPPADGLPSDAPPPDGKAAGSFASICEKELRGPNALESEVMGAFLIEFSKLGIAGCDGIGAYLERQDTLAFSYVETAREDVEGFFRYRPWPIANSVVRALAVLPRLRSLTLESMALVRDLSPLASMPGLEEVNLVGTDAHDFTWVAKADLRALSVRSQAVDSLEPLRDERQLLKLVLVDTQTSDLSAIANLTMLRSLIVTGNQVTDASAVANMTELTQLSLDDNQLTDLAPLAALSSLTDLTLQNNMITSLAPLGELKRLTQLNLARNQIRDISVVGNNKALAKLALSGNPITSFEPLKGLTALTELRLMHTGLPDLSAITRAAKLERLDLSDNPALTDLSALGQLPALRILAADHLAAGAPLDVASIKALTKLTGLSVSGDKLATLDVVSTLRDLTALIANDNAIVDLAPVGARAKLTRLDVKRNQIASLVPIARLTRLVSMAVDGNPIEPALCPVAPEARSKVLSDTCSAIRQ